MPEDPSNPFRSPTALPAAHADQIPRSFRWFGFVAAVTLFAGFMSTIETFLPGGDRPVEFDFSELVSYHRIRPTKSVS